MSNVYHTKYIKTDDFEGFAIDHMGRWVIANLISPRELYRSVGVDYRGYANLIEELHEADTEDQVVPILQRFHLDPEDFGLEVKKT